MIKCILFKNLGIVSTIGHVIELNIILLVYAYIL